MFSYSFGHIAGIHQIDFSKSIIWVFHADKIPPHIGFSTKNTFFSLKVSGKDEQLNAESVLELIQRKKIPALFIQLSTNIQLNELKDVYIPFEHAISGSVTCLTPIRNLLERPEANQLSDLLNQMTDDIEIIAGSHLPDNYNSLPSYSIEEIYSYIQELSNHVER